jgi:hypothetical protein
VNASGPPGSARSLPRQSSAFVLSGYFPTAPTGPGGPPFRSAPTKPVETFVELEKLGDRIGISIRNLDVGDLPVGEGSLDLAPTRSTRQRSSAARGKCVEQDGRIVSGRCADLSPHRRALVSGKAVERSGVQDQPEIAADIGGTEVGPAPVFAPVPTPSRQGPPLSPASHARPA